MRHRRFLQFRSKLLLVAVTLFCVWLGLTTRAAKNQREAVDWVLAHRGKVRYDWQFNSNGDFDETATPPGPRWLRGLIGPEYFQKVTYVLIFGEPLDNIEPLGKLEHLTWVNLTSTETRDIRPLAKLKSLRVAWLPGNQIEDITPLAELSALEELYIFKNRIRSLAAVRRLPNLRFLSASENPLSDRELHVEGRQ